MDTGKKGPMFLSLTIRETLKDRECQRKTYMTNFSPKTGSEMI